MRLSVLDQSVAVAGRPHDQSIRNTVALARHCETLGYERFWVSEHHNHPTIVGTAPEIVMAAIAATTERIRIGSAGIMLPHYSAFKVAEVFRVLDALAPGRIDMGLGRAPGSDGRTAFALNPMATVEPAIKINVSSSTNLRPCLSAMAPKITAPTGRVRNPTPKVPTDSRRDAVALPAGNMIGAITCARKASYSLGVGDRRSYSVFVRAR